MKIKFCNYDIRFKAGARVSIPKRLVDDLQFSRDEWIRDRMIELIQTEPELGRILTIDYIDTTSESI